VLLALASSVHPAVGMAREEPGWGTLLFLRAAFGRRPKIVGFQYIVHRRRHPLRALLNRYDRWAVRRAVIRIHALTRADQDRAVDRYGFAPERIGYVPWPLALNAPALLPDEPDDPLVMCAGRAGCDWQTLFQAAHGSGWPLVVVCDPAQARGVRALNVNGTATVHEGLPRDEFFALRDRATISLVVMRELNTSQGHVRLMDAMAHGVCVVATATESIRGYVEDEENVILVAPSDAASLRAAVDRLLGDAAMRERLRRNAFDRARAWNSDAFLEALAPIMHGGTVVLPAAAPDPMRSAPGIAVTGA
jgi:glycosyltransferase involved in cell wall biosynthesis